MNMTLRIGLIGTGWFADMHAKLLHKQQGIELAAVVGSSLQKAEAFAGRFHHVKVYEQVEQMLDDQRLDAVYICTPPFAHGHIESLLIKRHIPFLVEKPLSSDESLPSTIVDHIREKQLITSVGYHFRYMDGVEKAKQLLENRHIAMSLGYWMGGAPGGTWWRKLERSGGQFVEQTTHIVDLLRYLVGEVEEVYAAYSSGILSQQDPDSNVADAGTVTLKLVNGTVATISNTCILPAGDHVGLHLYTNQGKVEISHNGVKDILPNMISEYLNESNPYEKETDAFLYAVKTGDTSRIKSSYEDAYKTHQVTMAANRSATTGQIIKLN